jgi:NADH-quinone oxidoreductase subunit E
MEVITLSTTLNRSWISKQVKTTADGMFTLKTVECLGACGYAPMMQMGKFFKEHLTKEKVDQVIEECRKTAAINN